MTFLCKLEFAFVFSFLVKKNIPILEYVLDIGLDTLDFIRFYLGVQEVT
jgi:hypothetical protein